MVLLLLEDNLGRRVEMTAVQWCSLSYALLHVHLMCLPQVSLLTGGADWSATVIPASRRMGKVRHGVHWGEAGWPAGDRGCPVPRQSVPGANWMSNAISSAWQPSCSCLAPPTAPPPACPAGAGHFQTDAPAAWRDHAHLSLPHLHQAAVSLCAQLGTRCCCCATATAGATVAAHCCCCARLLVPSTSLRIPCPSLSSIRSCDSTQAQKTVCDLAELKFKRLLMMHDATDRGLAAADVAALAASLPICRKGR